MQDVDGVASGCGQDQQPEQAQEFMAGDGDEVGVPVAVRRGAFEGGGDGEEGVGDQGGGAPAVPGGPGGDLALVQAVVVLAVWKSSSIRHLQHTTHTSFASGTGAGDQQRKNDTVPV